MKNTKYLLLYIFLNYRIQSIIFMIEKYRNCYQLDFEYCLMVDFIKELHHFSNHNHLL